MSLFDENLISLSHAARLVPGLVPGKPIDRSTLYRWTTRGVDGVRLERVKIGGRYFTTLAALERFSNALSAEVSSSAPSPSTVRGTRSAAERAGRELDRIL